MIGTLDWASDCREPGVSQPGYRRCVRRDGPLICTRMVRARSAGLAACVVHANAEGAPGKAGQHAEENGRDTHGDQPGPVQRQRSEETREGKEWVSKS